MIIGLRGAEVLYKCVTSAHGEVLSSVLLREPNPTGNVLKGEMFHFYEIILIPCSFRNSSTQEVKTSRDRLDIILCR